MVSHPPQQHWGRSKPEAGARPPSLHPSTLHIRQQQCPSEGQVSIWGCSGATQQEQWGGLQWE